MPSPSARRTSTSIATTIFTCPAEILPITHWLRDAGYYTANVRARWTAKPVGTHKTDLNFEVEGEPMRSPGTNQPRRAKAVNAVTDTAARDFQNEIRLFHSDNWADLRNSISRFSRKSTCPWSNAAPKAGRGRWTAPGGGKAIPGGLTRRR